METGIIVQARMASVRLPGKVLKSFCGKSLLQRIIEATSETKDMALTVVATSVLPCDDVIEDFCKKTSTECFRGDEQNVLNRYYHCAMKYGFNTIVRMTADNPFPDIEELRRLIDFHKKNQLDYSENLSTLPLGVGAEIFSFKALCESMEHATLPKHFEHVNEYILDNLDKFNYRTLNTDKSKNYPEVRLTVDTENDYKRACYIISHSGKRKITTQGAIKLCREFEESLTMGVF